MNRARGHEKRPHGRPRMVAWACCFPRDAVAQNRAVYDRMYDIYLDLYRTTLDQTHALASMQAKPERT
jgi:hypothetical protein